MKKLLNTLQSLKNILLTIFTACMLTMTSYSSAAAQDHNSYIRIAKIVVDIAQLENYKAALKTEMETAVRVEKGVLSLYAVCDKIYTTHITVFEIYADEDAYKSHIQTEHFRKYKDTVKQMVKSLDLSDVVPIILETKSMQ